MFKLMLKQMFNILRHLKIKAYNVAQKIIFSHDICKGPKLVSPITYILYVLTLEKMSK